MRKIESQMCAAIQANINWSNGNTTVHFNEESGVSIVRLHGNKIAEVSDNDMTIFDGGWQSNTTKSRLNAIINEFCNAYIIFKYLKASSNKISLYAYLSEA